jgi:hypothetical protein
MLEGACFCACCSRLPSNMKSRWISSPPGRLSHPGLNNAILFSRDHHSNRFSRKYTVGRGNLKRCLRKHRSLYGNMIAKNSQQSIRYFEDNTGSLSWCLPVVHLTQQKDFHTRVGMRRAITVSWEVCVALGREQREASIMVPRGQQGGTLGGKLANDY